ncbi:acyltransferase family protein [Microlunatus flavus]|uniref:Peptidoglycan/LPS O-acetylase OafA/YrhL, contains acyltransferase and SGNH-hydrolase domains n=1 Tax=Microlunatus flavus TaxID=1036181 RepID=A0A1H9KWM4_9ACTN|nr:acyltransferase [Microlunatus flavus]SER03594.1 Peptidoglycan/LPS O-acetylase OafA/YrhL, contains acyltransferase and SGNH-hydrolase domains [Microlunatus flavus]
MQQDRHPRFLARFSRVTTRETFVPEVDGLRFLAVMAVIAFHLAINLASRNPTAFAYPVPGDPLHLALRSGELGVQLFFIVSGLVLALPFARHHLLGERPVSLRAYFLRRLTRLEPPYALVMIGCFLLLVVVHGRSPAALAPHLLASLLYVHDLVYARDSVINNVAWSLEVEIQFYLLVPWLTLLLAIRSPAVRRTVIVAAVVLTSLVGPQLAGVSPHLENTLLRFAQYFLVGFLLADLMVSGQLRRPRSLLWDALALATVPLVVLLHTGTGVATWLPSDTPARWVAAELALPWLFLVVCLAAFRGVVLNAFLRVPLVTTVGGMCYSIYLLHNVLLNNTLFVTKDLAPTGVYGLDLAVQALVMVPFVVAVSAVFFVLVERPCMDRTWPQRLRAWVVARTRVTADVGR